ncbi:hypothetical protein N7532_011475 [Penicillium argentinense]|uniref:Uncharacterized protein n=1 Tax=Penicillium argentinense TaxID=1131581 RepID=A0A9W9EIK7_9EURO|nr:uncharacterized protein N7532_011475 [Penicillium argentinense]KAJ5082432.1 hypothetical protein N7532_011475 [Penicillium argentinense]
MDLATSARSIAISLSGSISIFEKASVRHGGVGLDRSFPVRVIQLLLQSSGLSANNTIRELESNPDTLALANRLDGLPLAIVIAGALMRETGTSITEYYSITKNLGPTYSYNRILDKRDPNAESFYSYLLTDNRDIWYELVRSGCHSSNVPAWLKKTVSSELTFKIGVKTLIGFSLLEAKEQAGSYAMHPVVQDWCIHLAKTDKNVDSIQLDGLALISVGYIVPSSKERNYSALQQRLLPHANYVRHRSWSGDNIAISGAFLGLGDLYSDQGELKEAGKMYWRALAGREAALGPDNAATLDTVHGLGYLYRYQGKLKEAEEMYQRALAGYERALGPDHPSTLNTANNLGLFYSDQGKLKEAKEMCQRALEGTEKTLGPDHTATLRTVHGLGLVCSDQVRFKEAEEMYQRALAGYEKALGPDHTSTLDAAHGLGLVYSDQGKFKEAEEMYQRVLTGKEQALDPGYNRTRRLAERLNALKIANGK